MRIRMNSLAAGPDGVRSPGVTYDVPEAEGNALVVGNYATPLDEPTPSPAPQQEIETATAPTPAVEHAVAPVTGRRNRR